MPGDSILDHPDLNALDDLERSEAARAMDDPEARQRLMLRTLLALRAEQKSARSYCRETCAPSINKRLSRLERWRWLLTGGFLVLFAVWEWLRDRIGMRS